MQSNTELNAVYVVWYEYSGGNLSVTNSTISSNGNGGGNDGGIFVQMYDDGWNGNHGNRTGTVTITGNTINSNNYNGIYLYSYVNDYNTPGTTLINATVSNNTIGSNTNYGLRFNASGYNTSMAARISAIVNGNTIQNHTGASDAGIYTVTNAADTRGQIAVVGSGNTITGNYYGIYQNNSYFENITLTEGTISGNTNYAVLNQYASQVINVTNNWWGVGTGPSAPGVAGNRVSTYVSYIPYQSQPSVGGDPTNVTVDIVTDAGYGTVLTTEPLSILSRIFIRLQGTDTDAVNANYTDITVSSTGTGAGNVTVRLFETGVNTGIFTGYCRVSQDTGAGSQSDDTNNYIEGASTKTITATSAIAGPQQSDNVTLGVSATWYKVNTATYSSPEVINATMTLPSGYTLTVEDGVTAYFGGTNVLLDVLAGGTLNVLDNEAADVTWTTSGTPAAGSWYGLRIWGTATIRDSIIQYAQ